MLRYERKPEHDRRIRRGDDFAGDAWLDTKTKEIVYTVVGVDRNDAELEEQESRMAYYEKQTMRAP